MTGALAPVSYLVKNKWFKIVCDVTVTVTPSNTHTYLPFFFFYKILKFLSEENLKEENKMIFSLFLEATKDAQINGFNCIVKDGRTCHTLNFGYFMNNTAIFLLLSILLLFSC
jgi:hypothetical protein